LHPAER